MSEWQPIETAPEDEVQRLRAEVERLQGIEELYKAGCAAWNPVFKVVLDERNGLREEVERLQNIINAADRGSPIYKAIERTLDEKSAWIARPSHGVTQAVALTAGIAWGIHYPLQLVDENLSLQLDNHRLTAEVERLRAALQEIAREQSARTATEAADRFQSSARAALEEKP